MSMSTKIR